jgi:hypothetical protein
MIRITIVIKKGQSLKLHQRCCITSASTKPTANECHPDAPGKVVPGRGGSGIEVRIGEKRSGSNSGARSPGKHHQAGLRVGKCRVYHLHVIIDYAQITAPLTDLT